MCCLYIVYIEDIFSLPCTEGQGGLMITVSTMAQYKTTGSPLLTHWRYCSLVLSYLYHMDTSGKGCKDRRLSAKPAISPLLIIKHWIYHSVVLRHQYYMDTGGQGCKERWLRAKAAVSPLLIITHWRYLSLVLSHWYRLDTRYKNRAAIELTR